MNARELHDFLGSRRQFSHWIKERIEQYDFKRREDYEVLDNFGLNRTGGRPTTEYHITLDMAKELAMVERNQKDYLLSRTGNRLQSVRTT